MGNFFASLPGFPVAILAKSSQLQLRVSGGFGIKFRTPLPLKYTKTL